MTAIWDEPRLTHRRLGLAPSSAGEILIAAQVHFRKTLSINRIFFDAAVRNPDPETALPHWYACSRGRGLDGPLRGGVLPV